MRPPLEGHVRPARRPALDVEDRPDLLGPLGHVQQPEPAGPFCALRRVVGGEASGGEQHLAGAVSLTDSSVPQWLLKLRGDSSLLEWRKEYDLLRARLASYNFPLDAEIIERLRGTILRDDDPFGPATDPEDWEAAR